MGRSTRASVVRRKASPWSCKEVACETKGSLNCFEQLFFFFNFKLPYMFIKFLMHLFNVCVYVCVCACARSPMQRSENHSSQFLSSAMWVLGLTSASPLAAGTIMYWTVSPVSAFLIYSSVFSPRAWKGLGNGELLIWWHYLRIHSTALTCILYCLYSCASVHILLLHLIGRGELRSLLCSFMNPDSATLTGASGD